jgi:L-threonylcarbamoyladenylate synthase
MDFESDIQQCVKTLETGGVILYPTDTVWGLGCDATNFEAVAQVYRIKQRSDAKSMIVLVAGERDILQYVPAPDLAVFDFLEAQTRPTTVIYDNVMGLAENIAAADGSVAIRITADPFCKALIKRFRRPIVSTSANISGQPAPAVFTAVQPEITAGVNYVVKHRQDDAVTAQPSIIIRWKDGGAVIIRS